MFSALVWQAMTREVTYRGKKGGSNRVKCVVIECYEKKIAQTFNHSWQPANISDIAESFEDTTHCHKICQQVNV